MTYIAGSPNATPCPLFALDHLKPVMVQATNPEGYMVEFATRNPVQAGNVIGWFESQWLGDEITVAVSQA